VRREIAPRIAHPADLDECRRVGRLVEVMKVKAQVALKT
jgi:hypothetical protein